MTPRERLKLLADELRKLDAMPFDLRPIYFHMGYFEVTIPETGPIREKHWLLADEHTCRTAGCAVGYAPYILALNAEGFSVRDGTIAFKNEAIGGFHSAQVGFGLNEDEANYLFDSSYYRNEVKKEENITPMMVAERIEKFVRNNPERKSDAV